MNLFEFAELPKNAEIPVPKIGRHIAVITTDTDSLNETGFGSKETCQTFAGYLKERYRKVTFHCVTTKLALDLIIESKPDLAVLCCKYMIDEDDSTKIWFSDYFSDHGIEHTGSEQSTLEFDSSKSKAKTLMLNADIPTAAFYLTHPDQFTEEDQLPLALPLFIKPINAANGNGIDAKSIARDFESYMKKVKDLYTSYGEAVLVEEVLPRREFTVAVFDDAQRSVRLIIPIEIIPPKNINGDRILGYAEKISNDERVKLVEEPLNTLISSLVNDAFTVLGARDFGRIDVKLDAADQPCFLEANLVPGMTPDTSYFPRAFKLLAEKPDSTSHNINTHKDVVLKVAELGLNRLSSSTPLSGIPMN